MGGKKVDRDEIGIEQFQNWVDWAKSLKIGLDFNQTYFSHPLVKGGFTLTHPDKSGPQILDRAWHSLPRNRRRDRQSPGQDLPHEPLDSGRHERHAGGPPEPARAPRRISRRDLQKTIDRKYNVDSVEPKLFGIGAESYTPGSHEFYLGYAVSRGTLLTLDAGHYHPTEGIADKISSVLCFLPEIALHVSRGVRWDSDHVVTLTDDLQAIAQEIVWGGYLNRVRIGLDYFDASINRIAAWVIGTRNMSKALLLALLAPIDQLRAAELAGDYTTRLGLMEDMKLLPLGAVWDYYCHKMQVPVGSEWLAEVKNYEQDVLAKRVSVVTLA